MNDNIDAIVFKAQNEIKAARNETMLENITREYLGKRGLLNRSLDATKQLPENVQSTRIHVIEKAKMNVEKLITKRSKELKSIK